jgi:hypothetical protein
VAFGWETLLYIECGEVSVFTRGKYIKETGLVAGLPPRRSGFDPGSVHVGFVVDKVALGQVFPRELRFSSVNFIPPVLHYLEK